MASSKEILVADNLTQNFNWVPASATEILQIGPAIDMRGYVAFGIWAMAHNLRIGAGPSLFVEAYSAAVVPNDIRGGIGATARASLNIGTATLMTPIDPGGLLNSLPPFLRIVFRAVQSGTYQAQFGGSFSVGVSLHTCT